ncbi:alpha/beta hydrolase [Nocardia cyriacigeorgica]|uniref:Alpha/beta hydrolase n=1 Tax=Nocardia cyriacigeorgica TaxID=135487 RepID=A0A5R8P7X3_9NOCA|nr:alpha/beta hydrolase [Nocardia cyriacigeorgica]TLF98280.1 alpha/beta hydrolase [Nocardia cyriacigeorgica]
MDDMDSVEARTVVVDGITMSALYCEVARPRAVIVALHGGATTARYFDIPGRPALSLLRMGAAMGYTVVALDRPGYGASALWGDVFDEPQRRVDASYDAIDALLDGRERGAGVFLAGHSAGCDLAVRMAADDRSRALLGLELAGTGVRKHPDAMRVIEQIHRTGKAGAIRALLWEPDDLYPPELQSGRAIGSLTPRYEAAVAVDWPGDFPELARRIGVDVRLTQAEHERVWRTDAAALAEIRGFFAAAPRVVVNHQRDSGHNISAGFGAAAYHRGLLSFVEECALDPAESPAR